MPEYRVRYVPWFIPWHRAITIWWPLFRLVRVYLPRSYRTDPQRRERAIAHEIVHVDQWYEKGRWRFLREYMRPAGRLAIEAPAFAASCRWWYERDMTVLDRGGVLVPVLTHYAEMLAEHYGLKYTVDDCRAAIEEHLRDA